MKKVLIVCGVFVFLLATSCVGVGWWLYRAFAGPIYEPGALATRTDLDPPAAPPSPADVGGWVVAPDVTLFHTRAGTGRTVLFVHGGPGAPLDEPMPWLGALSDAFTVRLYDQRGCGGSTRPFDRFETTSFYPNMVRLESTLGVGQQVADIERIRRLLGEERLLLVGHSFGGFLATMYAAEFPQHVENLVLLTPASMLVFPPAEDGDLFELVRTGLPESEHAAYDAFLTDYLNFGTLFEHDESTLGRRSLELGNFILRAMGRPPQELPPAGDPVSAGGWMVFAMYLSMGQRHDYTPALSRITAPTLVVHGTRDIIPVSGSRAYADAIPDAELLTLPDADHFYDTDLPDLTARVRQFLSN